MSEKNPPTQNGSLTNDPKASTEKPSQITS